MNKVFLIGRTTRDPDIRYSQGEQSMAIARFHLAVDRTFKKDGDDQTDFISCVSFGKTAEFIEKYICKGTKIAVVGKIHTSNYTNKDGIKCYNTEVIVEQIEFAGPKVNSDSLNLNEDNSLADDLAFIEN